MIIAHLTDNLNYEGSLVLEAVDLHGHLIAARVVSLRLADKQDAILVTVADIYLLRIQRLAILGPRYHRFRFALQNEELWNILEPTMEAQLCLT